MIYLLLNKPFERIASFRGLRTVLRIFVYVRTKATIGMLKCLFHLVTLLHHFLFGSIRLLSLYLSLRPWISGLRLRIQSECTNRPLENIAMFMNLHPKVMAGCKPLHGRW